MAGAKKTNCRFFLAPWGHGGNFNKDMSRSLVQIWELELASYVDVSCHELSMIIGMEWCSTTRSCKIPRVFFSLPPRGHRQIDPHASLDDRFGWLVWLIKGLMAMRQWPIVIYSLYDVHIDIQFQSFQHHVCPMTRCTFPLWPATPPSRSGSQDRRKDNLRQRCATRDGLWRLELVGRGFPLSTTTKESNDGNIVNICIWCIYIYDTRLHTWIYDYIRNYWYAFVSVYKILHSYRHMCLVYLTTFWN